MIQSVMLQNAGQKKLNLKVKAMKKFQSQFSKSKVEGPFQVTLVKLENMANNPVLSSREDIEKIVLNEHLPTQYALPYCKLGKKSKISLVLSNR